MVDADADEVDNAKSRDHPSAAQELGLQHLIKLEQGDKAQSKPTHAANSEACVLRRLALATREREPTEGSNDKQSDTTLVIVSTGFADKKGN
jgi:hypothetical protein